MKKTGLYANLLTHEIIEYDVKSSTYSKMIHNSKTKNLMYLGLKNKLATESTLKNHIQDLAYMFTCDIDTWLECDNIKVDEFNLSAGCYDEDNDLLLVKGFYSDAEINKFKQVMNDLGKTVTIL